MRTHTHQDARATPVPRSTPPEHLPNADHAAAAWDGLQIADADAEPE